MAERGDGRGERARAMLQGGEPPGASLERHVRVEPVGKSEPQRPAGGIVALRDLRAPGRRDLRQPVLAVIGVARRRAKSVRVGDAARQRAVFLSQVTGRGQVADGVSYSLGIRLNWRKGPTLFSPASLCGPPLLQFSDNTQGWVH